MSDPEPRPGDEPGGYKVGPGRPPKEHQWKPGQSGNPGGRPKGESITATLRRLLEQEHNGKSVQEILAEKVLREALSGKYSFVKELLDRLDGRPNQKVELATPENVTIFVRPPRVIGEGDPIPPGAGKVIRGVDPDAV
jgi:hypothetical protein